MSGSRTLTKPVRIDPPFADPVLEQSQNAYSKPWSRFYTYNSDRIAELTQRGGVTDGSEAPAGQIGEYLSASVSGVTLPNSTMANVVSLALSPGDWDVSGKVGFQASAGSHALFAAGVDGDLDNVIDASFATTDVAIALPTSVHRFNLTASRTVWVVAQADWSGGTMTAAGFIQARRMR